MKNKETANCGFDELIKLGKKEISKKNNKASLLILNPLGSMVYRSY